MNHTSHAAATPIIVIHDLVKQFGRFAALRGVSAEFAAGRLYAIVGENGAGKTTLLRSLAGLTQPTRGSISMLGTTDLRSVCSQLGYMALTRLVGQYSQGMRQRMSLARALIHDPKILLLDEPFSNVDTPSARQMTHLLTQLRDTGKTIFVVTHQASQLEHAADEYVHMEAGLIARRSRELITVETP